MEKNVKIEIEKIKRYLDHQLLDNLLTVFHLLFSSDSDSLEAFRKLP